ncbi:hydroxylase [Azospirillum cavernae]|uniref:Hydroxylase n=1 Tax=Azospirillum cavernae TaxID=2320860 RepID=A0A418VL56_9PROT|nr:CmcI family methyltransferase [Azospirillum cavernae]RJF76861.1 hydroxylase [Azospirillum cavernae]
MSSPEAFAAVTAAYLRCGWDAKYVYSFTWMGRPIIQLPDDLLRLQELIYRVKPDVIVETGVAHGGSLVFHASLCRAMGRGHVVGVDIEIRPHNRQAIESHELSDLITLIEGDSSAPDTVDRVRATIMPGERVLVILDSNHHQDHVLAELEAYAPLVSVDSWIVAMDGIMRHLPGAPRSQPDWAENNPAAAAALFAATHPDFELADPPLLFNEGITTTWARYNPDGFLRRLR